MAASLKGKELNKEEEADERQWEGSQRRKTDREGSMGGGQRSLAELSVLEQLCAQASSIGESNGLRSLGYHRA